MTSRSDQFDVMYMNIAHVVSKLSRCNRAKVGAVIVKDRNIVAYGYNGTPSGFCNECEENDVTKDEVIHAEMNAILKAGLNTQGATMYVTMSPCMQCSKIIKQSGLKCVIFDKLYRDTQGLDKLKINYRQL
jgi:dCMP deaminase